MANVVELYEQTQAWMGGREHFKTLVATAFERGPFAQHVADYITLLQEAFEPSPDWPATIPLETSDVESANLMLLTQLVGGLQQEFSNEATLSLSVSARMVDESGYLGLIIRRNDKGYCYVLVNVKGGNVNLEVTTTEKSKESKSVQRAIERLQTEVYSGTPWIKAQRGMQAADKVFKFIVSQTLPQIQEQFPEEIQEGLE
jgi:hypothetical protein